MSFLADNFPLLRDAFLTTLSLAVASGICALILGTLLAAMRVSPVPALRALATFYVEVFRNVVPPLGNVWIALAKNTSIAAGFAVTDLTAVLQRLANANADQLALVFLAVVVGYLIITLPSAWGIRVLERR